MADVEVMATGLEVLAALGSKDAQHALATAMTKAVTLAASQAKQNATFRPGPRVDTGRLRASINGQVTVDGLGYVGRVGTPVVYGPILEYGFDGPVAVRAHTRRMTMVFGQAVTPLIVTVRAHTRQVKRRAYPYFRPAIFSPFMSTAIARLLGDAVRECFGQ